MSGTVTSARSAPLTTTYLHRTCSRPGCAVWSRPFAIQEASSSSTWARTKAASPTVSSTSFTQRPASLSPRITLTGRMMRCSGILSPLNGPACRTSRVKQAISLHGIPTAHGGTTNSAVCRLKSGSLHSASLRVRPVRCSGTGRGRWISACSAATAPPRYGRTLCSGWATLHSMPHPLQRGSFHRRSPFS